MRVRSYLLLCLLLWSSALAKPDTALFDLTGPTIGVKVNRNGVTLPISQVPNLHQGDRLWVHPELPKDQSAHYLLVVTFLRGSTNPAPEKWFTRAECWSKKVREEGIFVVVPEDAEQAVIFLAPETSGDFSTLRSAVRGRPGAFVRAVQDLNRASLDRSRLDTYLGAMRVVADTDPTQVHAVSVLLARSLNIHLEDDCFKKPVEEQASCLTQKGGDLVLNDGHSQSIVGALTTGSPSDLVGQLAFTPQAGLGYFSPYIGAIMDMGRILDSLHTARYQYIPALSHPKDDTLELKLNNPPSFHNPKSVILVALPAIEKEEPPPLRLVDDQSTACVGRSPIVLPAQGAPLVFSTDFSHDMRLLVQRKSGQPVDLPVQADASKGGFVFDSALLRAARIEPIPGETLQAKLHGIWGFTPFNGPDYELHFARDGKWIVPASESSELSAGNVHVLHLDSAEAACVDSVSLKNDKGDPLKVQWKITKPAQLQITLPAESTKSAGPITLQIKEAGIKNTASVSLRVYGEMGQFKEFAIIPGDNYGTLQGTNLGQVESVELQGVRFLPQPDDSPTGGKLLRLSAADSSSLATLHSGEKLEAQVELADGRTVKVAAPVGAPRPRVTLLNKAVELGPASQDSLIHLGNQEELPEDAQLSFSLKSDIPADFARTEKVEISTADHEFHTLLDMDNGRLTLQDPHTVVGRFNPAKEFGSSAFGALQFRPVDERGEHGDWQPLATLVRLPVMQSLDCPADVTQQCTLKGANLFLLDSVSADPSFQQPASVPEGFIDSSLKIPHPVNGTLYLKLRDDPSQINTATFPATPPTAASLPQKP